MCERNAKKNIIKTCITKLFILLLLLEFGRSPNHHFIRILAKLTMLLRQLEIQIRIPGYFNFFGLTIINNQSYHYYYYYAAIVIFKILFMKKNSPSPFPVAITRNAVLLFFSSARIYSFKQVSGVKVSGKRHAS